VIDEFLAKGATMLLVAQAGSGKISFLYAAAAAVEEGRAFLEQIQTKQGRVLIIQGDEPENDCYNKLKIMDIEGVFDIVFPHPAGTLIGLKNSLGTTI
jgi:RecA-family ATPase